MRTLLIPFTLSLMACVGDGPAVTPLDAGLDGSNPTDGASGDAAVDASCGVVGTPCCAANACTGGATCSLGACACSAPLSACGAACVDPKSDPANCGACGHDCVGGACTLGVCQTKTVVTGQSYVFNLVASPTKLYWTRSPAPQISGGVFSSDLNGQNVTPLFDGGPTTYCSGLSVTATDAYFYCTGHLYRCALPSCGGTPKDLLAITGVGDVAFDPVNQRLYFATVTPYNSQSGGFIASVPNTGGGYVRLTAADQPAPVSLTIANGIAYWLDAGTYLGDNPQLNGGVRKAPVGASQTVTPVSADPVGADLGPMFVDGSTIYYGGGSARMIRSVPASGGSASTYSPAVSVSGYIRGIASDANYVYWTESPGGVFRCEKNCIKPTPLSINQDALAITQDANSIYWSNAFGEIRRLAK